MYVNSVEHRYIDDPVHREEGGTPAIIESIRAGLVFGLQQAVGIDEIRRREAEFLQRAVTSWKQHPNIGILGNLGAERLSIVSFTVRSPTGRFLHHNLVVALLHDLFGIQSRGGCSCAGPYGHRLLGIDLEHSHEFEAAIAGGCEGIKPGWVRINFNYFLSETVFDFVVRAVEMIADDGWRLADDYLFEPASGLWRHRDGPIEPPLRLSQLTYDDGQLRYPRHPQREPESALAGYLTEARQLFDTRAAAYDAAEPETAGPDTTQEGESIGSRVSAEFERLRWFELSGRSLPVDTHTHTPVITPIP